jgi:GNAT superfamily N-acetyltransferase
VTPPHAAAGRTRLLRQELKDLPVRRLTLADLAACSDLAESRGWGREEHKWRLLLTAGAGYGVDAPGRPGTLIGAFVLTSYASHSARTRAGTPADPASTGYTAISMVLVAEHCARQGLGRRMMRHALAACEGAVPFLTATDNGRPLYEQLGFTSVGQLTMLSGHFVSSPADGQPGRAAPVRLARAADMTAVCALDAPAFGADRTELLARLPAFADRFVVAEGSDGSLTGFAASWPNSPTTVIGPVVAEDLRTAKALIADLGSHAVGRIRFDVDARHQELETWLRAHGLTGDLGCTVMVHTAPDLPGDPDVRFAPYSVALG